MPSTMTPYSKKLLDPRWQKLRLTVLNRDDWTCQLCGAKHKTLHVHHRRYRGEPWEADPSDLKTICDDCHEAKHAAVTITFTPRSGPEYQVATSRVRTIAAAMLRACDEAELAAGISR